MGVSERCIPGEDIMVSRVSCLLREKEKEKLKESERDSCGTPSQQTSNGLSSNSKIIIFIFMFS